MNEQFVTYEIALLLKELGFDEECFGVYNTERELTYGLSIKDMKYLHKYNKEDEFYLTPLWQEAIDWLYEKHNVWIQPYINVHPDTNKIIFSYRIYQIINGKRYSHLMVDGFNETPNKLREKSILMALKNLKIKL